MKDAIEGSLENAALLQASYANHDNPEMQSAYEAGLANAATAIVAWLLSEYPPPKGSTPEEFTRGRTLFHVAQLIREGAYLRDHVVAVKKEDANG